MPIGALLHEREGVEAWIFACAVMPTPDARIGWEAPAQAAS